MEKNTEVKVDSELEVQGNMWGSGYRVRKVSWWKKFKRRIKDKIKYRHKPWKK